MKPNTLPPRLRPISAVSLAACLALASLPCGGCHGPPSARAAQQAQALEAPHAARAQQAAAPAAPGAGHAPASSAAPASTAAPSDSRPEDPARLRLRLLAAMDADIEAAATRAHLDARLLLDRALPIPYLGVDADPADGGMKVAHVYPATAAEQAGLRPGDNLRALAGEPVTSKATLGRAIRSHAVGESVDLSVLRDGAPIVLHATIGPRPEEDEDEQEQFPDLWVPPVFAREPVRFDFEHEALGALPGAFTQVLGGHGEPPRYLVSADSAAADADAAPGDRGAAGGRVLRQDSADITGIRFPMALVDGWRAADVEGRVRFRFAGGRIDRAAGIVLRYRDPGNYLVARVNAAEADLRIFRVAGGLRTTLPGGKVAAPCDDGAWHELSFRARGTELTASFNGSATATTHDAWFLDGGVGVWTKSDSLTEFDELSFTPLP
ncbi:MAG TPA: PDZ domain-containing protein [Planctomycetota bacterium]|nr:PDZ domain-containing protein [Planctomycetota bacterium]